MSKTPLTDAVIHDIGQQLYPLPWQMFFTEQRAPDMWFGDELPPSYQDFLNKPEVKQAQLLSTLQILQQIQAGEQRMAAETAFASASPKKQKKIARQRLRQMKTNVGH